MANQPQILARLWQSSQSHRSGAHESAKGVDAGWSFQLSSSEIQSSDGQNISVGNDTCKRNSFYSFKFCTNTGAVTHRRRLIEVVQENRNCISPQDRRNLHQFRTGRCELRPCYFRPKSIANFLLCRSTRNRRRHLTRTGQSCSRTNKSINNFNR